MSKKPGDLDSLRQRIKDIDAEIIGLIAERTKTAADIGRIKNSDDLPIKDYGVEQRVYDRNTATAKTAGLDPGITKDLTRLLIKQSLLVQHEERTQNKLNKRADGSYTISVIGASGGMGRWFCDFFESSGHQVLPLNIAPNDNLGPAEREAAITTALKTSDFIVVATPISASSAIIDLIADKGTNAIVFDVASVKSPILQSYETAKQKIKMASIHPMFGPATRILIDKNIIICSSGDTQIDERVASLFSHTSAKLPVIPLAKHDEYIAYVLGLSHFTSLVFAGSLIDCKMDPDELSQLASTTFLSQMRVTTPVVHENQQLYFEIQQANPFMKQVHAKVTETVRSLSEQIADGNATEFASVMSEMKDYFGRLNQTISRVEF